MMESLLERLREAFLSNLGTKLVSLLIAIVLWVVVLGSRNVEVTKEVPLELLVPPELVVGNEVPEKLAFRLSGPKAFLRAVLDRREEPIRVNLIGSQPGLVTYRFFSDNIRLPIGVRVMSVSPASIVIKLEQLKKREVPVRILTEGALPAGLNLKSMVSVPPTVMIKGAESKVDGMTEVLSVPVKLQDIRASQERDLALDLSRAGIQLEGSVPKLQVEIEGRGANYKIRNIEIRVESPHRVKLEPETVTALVNADPADLKKLNRTKVFATIEAAGRARGTYKDVPRIILPPNVTLVRTVPDQVTLTLY